MIAHIEAQGSLLSLKVVGYKSRPNPHGARRGVIRTFSAESRRRLMRFMARLKVRKIRATFLTLTFSEMVSHDTAKRVFKRFTMRVRRLFPQASAVWRLEYQPKRGAIHYHLLCFNLPFWKQAEVQKTWEECTLEQRSIVDIRLVHGARSIMAYVSKYIAKIDNDAPTSLDDGAYQHEGKNPALSRFWGWINKECLPLGQVLRGILTDRTTVKSLSSLIWSILGNGNPYNSLSCHLFCDNARWLCERAVEEGGCWPDEWAYTTKDHTTQSRAPEFWWHDIPPEPHSGGSVDPALDHARSSAASVVQPCIRQWVQPSCLREVQERQYPYFDSSGILVSIDSQ